MNRVLRAAVLVGSMILFNPSAMASRDEINDITGSIRQKTVRNNKDSDNACASLTGHAIAGVYGSNMQKWFDECNGNTTEKGLICNETKKALIERGGQHGVLGNALQCPRVQDASPTRI